jgi:hypothetical protein
MSEQSIVSATKTILTDALGDSFETIEDLDAIPFTIVPYPNDQVRNAAVSPCCLLQYTRDAERPVTHGRNVVSANVDAHIWSAVPSPTPEAAEDFKNLVHSVVVELRQHPRLDGLADVAGESQVTRACLQLAAQITRPIVRPNKVWQHAVITIPVEEFVSIPLVIS